MCEFADKDHKNKSHIIQQCTLSKLRRKAHSKPATTLQNLLEHGKTLDETDLKKMTTQPNLKWPQKRVYPYRSETPLTMLEISIEDG